MSHDTGAADHEAVSLEATARLLSSLLLTELEPAFLQSLEADGVRGELDAMGLSLPHAEDENAIELLAAEYFESFVKPIDGPPLVQSLAEGDAFEGEPARAMRAIAEAAGVEFDAVAARGATVDHLGSQLGMWGLIRIRDRVTAREFAERHLRWALPHLRRPRESVFYGRLSTITAEFIAMILADDPGQS